MHKVRLLTNSGFTGANAWFPLAYDRGYFRDEEIDVEFVDGLVPAIEVGHAVQKSLGVRMLGLRKLPGLDCLHHLSAIEDDDPVAEGADKRQVVADKNQPHSTLLHEVVQYREHLHLHGHVKRRGRFVSDKKLGLGSKHHGNHDALTHAARHLVRVEVVDAARIPDAHGFQRVQRVFLRLPGAHPAMRAVGFRDLPAHGHDRVQREFRILHDHRHVGAAQRAALLGAHREEILAHEGHPIGAHAARQRNKIQDSPPGERFA
jgi:hypothetical protein